MKKIVLSLCTIFSASLSLAQSASQLNFINQLRRPIVAEIVKDSANLAPFPASGYNSQGRTRIPFIKRYLPELIVSLEKAFPGGTYGFLGRDMDLVADAVDAYYLSIGQSGRVKRIEFSTPSLQGSTPALITEFLSQLGLENGPHKEKGPFVIIDYTSFAHRGRTDTNFPSQARHIFQSVVTDLKQKGLSSADIVSRVNIATLDNTASSVVRIYDPMNTSYSDYFSSQAAALDNRGQIDRITYLNVDGGNISYYSEWNDKYGPIQRNAEGKLFTSPIGYFEYKLKHDNFNIIVETINIARSKETHDRVEALAKYHNVTFEKGPALSSEDTGTRKQSFDKKLKENLNARLANLQELPAEKSYGQYAVSNSSLKLTENGNLVAQILSSSEALQAQKYFELSLKALTVLYEGNKIGARDFRRIFAHILTLKPIENPQFVERVAKGYKNILPLEIMFGREGEREKYLSQSGLGKTNYETLLRGGQMQLSCKFLLLSK